MALELLTVDEMAKLIHKSRKAVYADVARGRWPYIKNGRRVFFNAQSIEHLLTSHERPAVDTPSPDGRKGGAA